MRRAQPNFFSETKTTVNRLGERRKRGVHGRGSELVLQRDGNEGRVDGGPRLAIAVVLEEKLPHREGFEPRRAANAEHVREARRGAGQHPPPVALQQLVVNAALNEKVQKLVEA